MRHVAVKDKRWDDHYTRLARRERYPARSVYKLQEIQKRFAVIRRGNRILDLGCAPGSWLMYAAEITGSTGCVAGVDLTPVTISLPAHVSVHTLDIFELVEDPAAVFAQEFDVVLSDMAPATTGSRGVDAARSYNLCEAALAVARQVLRPGGAFVCKIFQGEDFKSFTAAVQTAFSECKIFKPQSCRKASKEIYLIGKGKTGGPHVRS
ncbi:MAG: RlmE family RNA methyltransferase [Desulfobacterales bacterium]|jgi:23S rRNA (uridine2552-2'-O)-methyltransferase|nr:RlmE family RNA methyltransferase [Desulfobacterales bacterium]